MIETPCIQICTLDPRTDLLPVSPAAQPVRQCSVALTAIRQEASPWVCAELP